MTLHIERASEKTKKGISNYRANQGYLQQTIAKKIFNIKKNTFYYLNIDLIATVQYLHSCIHVTSMAMVTGDINISLLNVLAKGPNYREPLYGNWEHNSRSLIDV